MIEAHINTRGCEPMQPETAAALARTLKLAYEQYAGAVPKDRIEQIVTAVYTEVDARDNHARDLREIAEQSQLIVHAFDAGSVGYAQQLAAALLTDVRHRLAACEEGSGR